MIYIYWPDGDIFTNFQSTTVMTIVKYLNKQHESLTVKVIA